MIRPNEMARVLSCGRGPTRAAHDLRFPSGADRDVLERCNLSGWTYAEYGRRTGAHPSAVKSRAFRARRRLSALLVPHPSAG